MQQAPLDQAIADIDHGEQRRREQLTRLVNKHQASLWRYVRYLGAAAAEADDLVQETFLSIARTAQRADDDAGGGGFQERSEHETAGYLRAAARNQLLMLRRRQKRQVSTAALEAAETAWAAADTTSRGWDHLLDSLGGCLEQLSGRPRRAIDLQYRGGASREAIATKLGMKPDGVKTLLRRARQTLRECLERATQTDERGA